MATPLLRALEWADTDSQAEFERRADSIAPITVVAHTKASVLDFVSKLGEALGDNSEIGLTVPAESLPDNAPNDFTVNVYARLLDTKGESATVTVEDAARNLATNVDRDELLDLVVVKLDS